MMKILNVIFPPKCIFCGRILKFNCNIDVCEPCNKKLPFFKDNTGDSFSKVWGVSNFSGIICLYEYSGIIKDSIIRYKFFNKAQYYRTFAKLLSEKVKRAAAFLDFDVTVSVPLFHEKEFDRGYNQSYLISKVLSRKLHIQEGSRALVKVKNTGAQSLLAKDQRIENIKNAFRVRNPDIIKNKNILLVDDIFTTGATIDECSRVLKASGAKSVVAAVIASGRKY